MEAQHQIGYAAAKRLDMGRFVADPALSRKYKAALSALNSCMAVSWMTSFLSDQGRFRLPRQASIRRAAGPAFQKPSRVGRSQSLNNLHCTHPSQGFPLRLGPVKILKEKLETPLLLHCLRLLQGVPQWSDYCFA